MCSKEQKESTNSGIRSKVKRKNVYIANLDESQFGYCDMRSFPRGDRVNVRIGKELMYLQDRILPLRFHPLDAHRSGPVESELYTLPSFSFMPFDELIRLHKI